MSTDTELQKMIVEELDWDPSVNAAHITVAVKDQIVILAGYVPRYVDKENAEYAVKRIANVKAVVLQIEIKLSGCTRRSDLEIAENAVSAIAANTALPRDKIRITVANGRVTLDGEVEWRYQYEAAENSVRHLPGVVELRNQVAVVPAATAAQNHPELD